jgi:predicted DsbA family dithiol-disulfide isomerase
MHIDIFSDVICPWCYVGKRRFERALALRPVAKLAVQWRAFQLNPEMPAEGMDRQAYLAAKFGDRRRAEDIYARVREAGEGEGIVFAFDKIVRTPNTVRAHRLIRYGGLQSLQNAVVDRLFAAYFEEGASIGDIDTLSALAAEIGMSAAEVRSFLDSDRGEREVEAELATAYRIGISGVPCFIVDGRYALPGAQEPEAFLPLFDLGEQEAATPVA